MSSSLLFSLLLCTVQASAALVDRGGGLIYDNLLGVTWLQNVNLGAGTAYDDGASSTDGRMTWASADAWATDLIYAGHTEWRLPTVSPINGAAFNVTLTANGSTDRGFNISATSTAYAGSMQSELAHLFYNSLGNSSIFTVGGSYVGCGASCLTNTGPFSNLQSSSYWSGTEYAPTPPDLTDAFYFATVTGFQNHIGKSTENYAWAVHAGDIGAPVPLPPAAWLFGSGLVGLLVLGRSRK